MPALETIVSEIERQISARIAGIKYRFGGKYIEERVAGSRIVWVPGKDDYGPARSGLQHKIKSPRTRRAEFFAHCVASTFGDAEDLVNAVVYATHQVLHGAYEIDYGDWTDPDWLDRGYACVLRFVVDIPIVSPEYRVVTNPEPEFDTSTTVQGDGYLDAGETT